MLVQNTIVETVWIFSGGLLHFCTSESSKNLPPFLYSKTGSNSKITCRSIRYSKKLKFVTKLRQKSSSLEFVTKILKKSSLKKIVKKIRQKNSSKKFAKKKFVKKRGAPRNPWWYLKPYLLVQSSHKDE